MTSYAPPLLVDRDREPDPPPGGTPPPGGPPPTGGGPGGPDDDGDNPDDGPDDDGDNPDDGPNDDGDRPDDGPNEAPDEVDTPDDRGAEGSTNEPSAEPTPSAVPTPDRVNERAAEPSAEPTAEPAPEPVPASEPEPVATTSQEPALVTFTLAAGAPIVVTAAPAVTLPDVAPPADPTAEMLDEPVADALDDPTAAPTEAAEAAEAAETADPPPIDDGKPVEPPEPSGAPVTGGEPPSGGRDVRRLVLAGVALSTVALGVFTTVSTLRVKGDLTQAEVHLTQARTALDGGEIDLAIGELDDAGRLLGRSRRTLDRPDLRLAGFVPEIGNDIRIARAIVIGADDVVTTGAAALEEARALIDGDLDGDGLPVRAIADLAPRLRATADASSAAVRRVLASPDRAVTKQVAGARDRMIELLTPIADQVEVAADLAEHLPAFLGNDGPRRYLLAAANPAELRGVGGYLGSYSVLQVEDGQLDFGEFKPLEDLPELAVDAVPSDLLAPRYQRFGATYRFKNANMTPDMPSAAEVLVQQWKVHTGRDLDGVLVVDPFALATMLQVTGPVTISDGTRLDTDNAVSYLLNEAYATYDDATSRKSELGEAATLILSQFLGDAGAAADHLGDLSGIIRERHLLVYAVDDDEQAAFAAAGLDGSLPDPKGDFLTFVANSATNAKVDYWLQPRVAYDVELLPNGVAQGHMELTFHNGAPTTGHPQYVLGPSVDDLDVGGNRFYLSTYCATTCTFLSASGGLVRGAFIEEELGHPVAGTWVEVPAGGEQTLRYRWRTTDAWTTRSGGLQYRLTWRPQVMVQDIELDVRLRIPDGFRLDEATDGVEVDPDAANFLRFRGTPRSDLELEIRLVSIPTESTSS